MVTIYSPKRQFELVLQGTKFQKASLLTMVCSRHASDLIRSAGFFEHENCGFQFARLREFFISYVHFTLSNI
jgi:hypothetical protein